MVTVNYKLISLCTTGGAHGQIDATPGPTFDVDLGDFLILMDRITLMSNAERGRLHLALHAVVNSLTPAQLRAEVEAVAGLDLTI